MRHRRNEFSKETKRQANKRSGGICECHRIPHVFKQPCGLTLGVGNTFYEHIDPDAISGRNDLDNCAVLTKTCWSFKTSTHDLPVIAKSNRVMDRARGIRNAPSLPGSRDDPFKIKVNRRTVVDRATGEIWRR